jgi:hypothetical protein
MIVSTWKKSQDRLLAAWARKNSDHDGAAQLATALA